MKAPREPSTAPWNGSRFTERKTINERNKPRLLEDHWFFLPLVGSHFERDRILAEPPRIRCFRAVLSCPDDSLLHHGWRCSCCRIVIPSDKTVGKQHVYGLDGGDLPHIIHGDIRCLLLLCDERPTHAEMVYWQLLSWLPCMFLCHLQCVFNGLA